MLRRFLKIVVALVALAPAASAVAQPAGGSIAGLVRDASGAAIPGATVRIVNEVTGVSLQAVSDEQGGYRTDGARPRGVHRRDHARWVRGGRAPDRALGRPDRRRRRHAESVTVDGVGRGDRAPRRGSGAGGPNPAVGRRRRPCGEHRVLQRQPSEGTDPGRPVLLDQSTELGNQHQGSGRAVRPDERWPRAGRRAVHRRRLLLAARVGDARLPRRRSHRSAARTAGHALRQEHDRRRDQRLDPQTELHTRHGSGAQCRRSGIRSGEGRGNRPPRPEGGGPAVVLRHGARRYGLQRSHQ